MSLGLRAAGITALSAVIFLAGCASSQQRMRREQREKVVQNAHLYCEFLSGEQYPDIDVALNLQMAQKCDSDGSMTITSYKTPSEIPGVLFCCSMHKNKAEPVSASEREREHEHAPVSHVTEAPPPPLHHEPKAEAKHEARPVQQSSGQAQSYPLPEVKDNGGVAKEVSQPAKEEKVEVKTNVKTEVKTKVDNDLDE